MKARNSKTARLIAALVFIALCVAFTVSAAGADVVTISTQNTNPIAKNLEYTTFKGVAIRGKLEAVDPDGDDVSYEITAAPKKGAVQSQNDGTFVYTPDDGEKGRDTFSYVAVDKSGGISFPATVTIKINKQSTKITYADMSGDASCYASLLLAEKGILTGEKLGNEYFFRPQSAVTRGEFLAMCMALTGTQTLEGMTRTGFSDDDNIPMWAKPYVSAALLSGIITGFKDDEGRLVFASEEPVTVSEAAVILDKALGLTDVDSVSAETGACIDCAAVPSWACQSEANLESVSIMGAHTPASYSTCLTRAEAADMLAAADAFMQNRDVGGSLLSWAK
jgi:hypothetical protein